MRPILAALSFLRLPFACSGSFTAGLFGARFCLGPGRGVSLRVTTNPPNQSADYAQQGRGSKIADARQIQRPHIGVEAIGILAGEYEQAETAAADGALFA